MIRIKIRPAEITITITQSFIQMCICYCNTRCVCNHIEQVKVFVVLNEGETTTQEELIEYCKDKLASYKLPTMIEFRDELPKTNVGKVLKKDLRAEELAKQG